jgi:serine/threonine protein phosphatase PrpC/formylglycine-generating enzyme required for sulfatase activity
MFLAHGSDVGRHRELNEDTVLVREVGDAKLLILCDGMGGHTAGDVASQEAALAIAGAVADALSDGRARREPVETLSWALLHAHEQVLAEAARTGARGMGCTAVVALVLDGSAWVAWVGDSRLYHFNAGRLEHRTVDHSRVQAMVDHGILTPEEAAVHPDSHVLTMAIGGSGKVVPSVWGEPIVLREGDVLLLSSDGLHNSMDENDLAAVMGGQEPQRAAELLVREANTRDGSDNISVALLSVDAVIPTPQAAAQPSSSGSSGGSSSGSLMGYGIAGLAALLVLLTGVAAVWMLSRPPVEPELEPVVLGPFADRVAAPCPPPEAWPEGMVCVHGGVFEPRARASTCPKDGESVYAGGEPVWVDSYFLDAAEVSNGDWNRCESACACPTEVHDDPALLADLQPRVSVSFDEAVAYCGSLGKRLATETEWDQALRGSAQAAPDVPSCSDATFAGCSDAPTPRGATAARDGLMDMVGNAPEWVADRYVADRSSCLECRGVNPTGPSEGDFRVVKGGSYTGGVECAFGEQRRAELPDNPTRNNFGFRCAADLEAPVTPSFRSDSEFAPESWYEEDPLFRNWRTKELGIEDVRASYKDPAMVEQLVAAYAAAFPDITRVHTLGTSRQGRPILALQVTDFDVPARDKPTVLLNGAHHGHELLSVEYTFEALDELLMGVRHKDERALARLSGLDIWVVPVVNPDGLWLTMYMNHGQGGEKLGGRKNGLDFPRVCEPGTDRPGVDLNRNYPYGWGEKGSSGEVLHHTYRGTEAASEPETRAMMDLAEGQRFVASLTYHTKWPAIITPYTVGNRKNPNPDVARHIATLLAPSGFQVLSSLYPVAGTDQDWLFHTYGTLAFIVEGDKHNPVELTDRYASVRRVAPISGQLMDLVLDGPRVTGFVVDANGDPMEANVVVEELATFEDEAWSSRPDGRFDRLVVEPGPYTVTATRGQMSATATVSTTDEPVTLTLR